MDFLEYPMTYSPNPNDFEDLFRNESICMDDDISCINPDDFLNLDGFKSESFLESSGLHTDHQYSTQTPQQLTPPISPQPSNIAESSVYQKVRLIPITVLQQQTATKVKAIVPKPSSSSDSDTNVQQASSPKPLNSPVDKALIKQQRLIRNRESAIISRIKKKEYVTSLESENIQLRRENTMLKTENSQLKARLKSYSALTSTLVTKLPSKNATMMLAVLFMVGFNVVPFSNFVYKVNFRERQPVEQLSTRHLLFINSSAFRTNDTTDSSEDIDVPVYFNQTDHIRKVNIENIKRWIPEPDLFNVSYIQKDFDFNTDPLQDKLAKMFEKSREQSQNEAKPKKRMTKKRPLIGPVQSSNPKVQLYNSNLNIIKLNEFFDEIDRKDDTFYVFSFRADHLLLPAIDSYNFSQIKMNLIMPRNNDSLSSDKITMMQIETIILNTSLIQITEKSIPVNFLKSATVNSTSCNENSLNGSEKEKRSFNDTAITPDTFQPIGKAARFPSYFNAVDLLKPKK